MSDQNDFNQYPLRVNFPFSLRRAEINRLAGLDNRSLPFDDMTRPCDLELGILTRNQPWWVQDYLDGLSPRDDGELYR